MISKPSTVIKGAANPLRPLLKRLWWPFARYLLRQVRSWEQHSLTARRAALIALFVGLLSLLALSVQYGRRHLFKNTYSQNSTNTLYGNPDTNRPSQARRP